LKSTLVSVPAGCPRPPFPETRSSYLDKRPSRYFAQSQANRKLRPIGRYHKPTGRLAHKWTGTGLLHATEASPVRNPAQPAAVSDTFHTFSIIFYAC